MKYEGFTIGQKFRSADFFLSFDQMYEFSKMYDPQPMHLDAELANESEFGGLIASGYMSLALGWKLWIECGFQDTHGKGGIAVSEAKWHSPLYPETTVHAETTIADLRVSSKGKGIITFDIALLNGKDQVHTTFRVVGIVEREADYA